MMNRPKYSRSLLIGTLGVLAFALLTLGQAALERTAVAAGQESIQAPIFEVDPLWPKPLPNSWVQGMTIGLAVDFQDNVWIVHRNNMLAVNEIPADGDSPITQGECCFAAPPVLAFNQAGDLIQHWGGPGEGYEWPQSNHGLAFDHKDNIWIGGNGADDAHVLKFTKDGQFLMQLGRSGGHAGSNDRENFGRVAKIFVDAEANEAYIADGYGNRRVAVVDADSGEFKRYWGAYGNRPDDSPLPRYNPNDPPAQQFRSPVHCAELSNDRLLYVCDRAGDRIQVFHPDGTFVKEGFIEKETLGGGSAWDIAFSSDPDQRYIYLADGVNSKVHIIDRESLEVLTSFGDGGRHPGQWYGVHSIATDSQGNIYTTETYEGKRLQKFVYKGVGSVKRYQGVLWPSSDD